jgi:peptidyl-prolyl cis-trans isomerase SurA
VKKNRMFPLMLAVFLAAAAPASARIVDGVVAVIDDDPVTFSEVRDSLAEGLGIPVGDADIFLREEREVGRVLRWIESLAESVLVRRELARTEQAVTDAEIERAVDSIRRSNNMTAGQFAETLAREGLTPETYRRRIRWQMERGAIVRARKLKDVTVTDEEIRIHIRENAERLRVGAEVRLETLNFPVAGTEEVGERAAGAKIAAQQASEHVRAGRTLREAAELVKGTFPGLQVTASEFVRTEDLLPEIQREVRRLRTGDVSPPFFGEGGGYLVRVLARRGGTLPEFAALKETLSEEMAERRSEKAFADILAELKKAASIDIRL